MTSERLTPPTIPPVIYQESQSFADYIAACKSHIKSCRVDLNNENAETIINANLPREYIPATQTEKGVLLIHGLLDSPGQMESLETSFKEAGYLVRSLLLPGHGTRPGELMTITVNDWIETVHSAITHLSREVNSLIVAGFSTGASLAIYEALKQAPIDALILFAPAIEIKNPLAFATRWTSLIGRFIPRANWFYIGEDKDYEKYQSIPFNGIAQVYQLTQLIKQQKPLTVPMLMIITDSDEAISTPASEAFFFKQSHALNQLILYSNDRKSSSHPQMKILPTHDNEKHILDYSHVCLPINPNHPHYGQTGDFQDASHYENWWGKIFLKEGDIFYGALTTTNLKTHYLYRLTYNPQYDQLIKDIFQFINAVTRVDPNLEIQSTFDKRG